MLFATFAAQVCMSLASFEAAYLIWGAFSSRFSVADAEATGTILAFLCLGLSGWAAQTVISRGFYALGNTWLPTLVGTAIAFAAIPLYVVLRQVLGAIGLAMASSLAILAYVLILGWLQRRRFEREAATRGGTLRDSASMLGAALRLAGAAGVAIAAGSLLRSLLMHAMPGTNLPAVIMRTVILCAFGLGIYFFVARILGVREMDRLERLLLRRLSLSRPARIL